MTVFDASHVPTREALPVNGVSRAIDRIEVTFDDETLVADAGLIVPATLMVRLGLEQLINRTVRLVGQIGGALPGRKVLTLVAAILVGGSHIDHADRLRAGATQAVLPFRVMATSTLGTFLRAFTFGHIRQLDRVIAETIRRAWALGAGPGSNVMTIDLDSTICEVHGKAKHGAAYGYTKVFGYHPLLATRADTGEVLHARLRRGSSQRGAKRFVEELIARARRGGASGALTLRADSGFFSWELIETLNRLGVAWSITVSQHRSVRKAIAAINDSDWIDIAYPDGGHAQVAETTYVTGGGTTKRSGIRGTTDGSTQPVATVFASCVHAGDHAYLDLRLGDCQPCHLDHRRHRKPSSGKCQLAGLPRRDRRVHVRHEDALLHHV
jgi:Transposase DDE domain group 1